MGVIELIERLKGLRDLVLNKAPEYLTDAADRLDDAAELLRKIAQLIKSYRIPEFAPLSVESENAAESQVAVNLVQSLIEDLRYDLSNLAKNTEELQDVSVAAVAGTPEWREILLKVLLQAAQQLLQLLLEKERKQ